LPENFLQEAIKHIPSLGQVFCFSMKPSCCLSMAALLLGLCFGRKKPHYYYVQVSF
jgi:hypothetical protein